MARPEHKPVALVLSGGGSRGAYEAGVLLYIRDGLRKKLGRHANISIVTGTSVGAINAAFTAASMDDPDRQAERLCDNWRTLEIEDMISLKAFDVLKAGRLLMGAKPDTSTEFRYRFGGILNTAGLEKFVVKMVPWRGIRRNITGGHVSALAISTTHVGSGHTVVFIEKKGEMPSAWSRDPHVRPVACHISPRHVLASAASARGGLGGGGSC